MKRSLWIMACLVTMWVQGVSGAGLTNPPSATDVQTARYVGVLAGEQAAFKADYDLVTTTEGETRVLLLSGPVGPTGFKASSRSTRIGREGDSIYATVQGDGKHHVTLTFSARVESSQDIWKSLQFTAGPALVRKIELSAAGEDSQVELVTGTTASTTHGNGTTQLTGFLDPNGNVAVRWQAKVREQRVKPVVLCNVHQLFELSPTVLKLKTRLVYEIPQGALEVVEARIPASLAVVGVSGEQIRDWSVSRIGEEQACRVELVKPVSGRYCLEIAAERAIEALPATLTLPEIAAAGVDRQGGTLAIVPDEVLLSITKVEGAARVNGREVLEAAGWPADVAGRLHASYQFPKPGYQCSLRAERILPRLTAVTRAALEIGENRALLGLTVALRVENAGVFSLALTTPAGFVVTDVQAPTLEHWSAKEEGGLQKLHLSFNRKVLGEETILISLEQTYGALPASLECAGVAVDGAERVTGMLGVSAATGLVVKGESPEGLRPVAVSALPARKGTETLGYAFADSAWRLTLKPVALRPRISAEVFNLVTLGDGFLTGSSTINYLVANAGVQELVLTLPKSWQNVDITGADIRRRVVDGETWTIFLQDRILGSYRLVITYDQPFDPQSDVVQVGGLKTGEAVRENGYVTVVSGTSLQVTEASKSPGLRPVDARELPACYRAMIESTVLSSYSYASQPYTLSLKTARHEQRALLDAIADHVKLVTVVSSTGRRETQITYLIKNSRRDALRLKLPEGGKLWSAFLDGKAVKPEWDQGSIVIPLKPSPNPDRAVPVEITYVEQGKPIRGFPGTPLALVGPRADMPACYAQWEVYLPSWIQAGRFSGSTGPERASSYTLGSTLDLVAGSYHKIFRAHIGGALVMGVLLCLLFLAIVAVRAGHGKAIGTALVIVMIGALFLSISIPSFVKARNTSQQNACINNLRIIDAGKEQWAMAMRRTDGDDIEAGGVNQYIKGQTYPVCPSGGRYVYGRIGEAPRCVHPGHTFPGAWETPAASMQEGTEQAADNRKGPSLSEFKDLEPVALGLLPVRIGLPKEGRAWLFSKVLNTDREPLTINARLISLSALHVMFVCLSAALLLAGIVIGWKNRHRSSTGVWAGALAVAFLGTATLAFAEGLLYPFVMGIPPLLLTVALAGVLRRKSANRDAADEIQPLPDVKALIILGMVAMMTAAAPDAQAQTNDTAPAALQVQISKASYRGVVQDGVAAMDATLTVEATAPKSADGRAGAPFAAAEMPLLTADLALQEFNIPGRGARLTSVDGSTRLRVERAGSWEIRLRFVAKVSGDSAGKRLVCPLPESVSAIVDCSLDEKEAAVTAPTAVAVTRVFEGERTNVQLILGTGRQLELQWVPRMKRAREVAVSASCRMATRVHVGEGAVTLRSGLAYQVTQGEVVVAKLQLPAGLRLLRVVGDKVRTWDAVTNAAGAELTIEMKSAAGPDDVVGVETELSLPELPASVRVMLPSPVGVQRVAGFVTIDADDEILVTAPDFPGSQQIDPAEYPLDLLVPLSATNAVLQAHRFWTPDAVLGLKAQKVEPDIQTVATETLSIGEKDLVLKARLDYEIRKAGVYELLVSVPAAYEMESVQGDNIRQWKAEPAGTTQVVRVSFVEKQKGHYRLEMGMRMARDFAKETAVPAIVPLNVRESSGFVGVGSEFGITLLDHGAEGITPMPVNELPWGQEGSALAFKFREPVWTLTVLAEQSPAWIQAEGLHRVHVAEGRLNVESEFRYAIQNAPADRFDIVLPDQVENLRVEGASIRQFEQNGSLLTILPQSKVSGNYSITLLYDVAVSSGVDRVVLPCARTQGPEREQGVILVSSIPSLHVLEADRSKQTVLKSEIQDMPAELLKKAQGPARLAYRYLRGGQQIALRLQRYGAMETLQASAETSRLISVVSDDGQTMTLATYSVRNNAKQYVQIDLPEGSQLWSCYVAGEPVRVAMEGSRALVPILPSGDDEQGYRIQINYIGKLPPVRDGVRIAMATPRIDIPVQNTHWEVYMPKGYAYDGFGGTARRIEEGTPTFREFGFGEYYDNVLNETVAKKKKVQELIGKAEALARKGDVSGARRQYRQAKQADAGNVAVDQGLQKLSRAEAYAGMNVSPMTGRDEDFNAAVQQVWSVEAAGTAAPAQVRQLEVALEQAEKIHNIQSASVGKVDQLKISLPVEGYRFVFEQILWTPDDEPVSVTMKAKRETKVGMLWGAALWALGVLLLGAFINGWRRRSRLQIIGATMGLLMLYVYVVFV